MAEISQETINALRSLRTWAKGGYVSGKDAARAVDVLDNAGVFAAIDTATDYDLDAVASTMPVAGEPDPAEWGDTTREDMARHQGYVPAIDRVGSLDYPKADDTEDGRF